MSTITNDTTRSNVAEGDLLDARTSGFVISFATTAIFNALLVLLKENVESVFSFMASLGHHWVTHGVFDLIVFFGLGFYLAGRGVRISGNAAVNYTIWATLIGGGIIFGFNLIHFLGG